MVQLGHFELFVDNLEASRRFYEHALGFQIVQEQPGGFLWLSGGPFELLLRPRTDSSERSKVYSAASVALVCYTTDFEAAVRSLAAEGFEPQGDDGPGCPTFQDPDGNWIQLVSTPS